MSSNRYDSLNDEQKEGVFTTEGPVLLLAGAGSGKTRVITYRIAHLIEDLGVSPYSILAITFTNKAAGEMKERVDVLTEGRAGGSWIMTFHAACGKILRVHADRLGYSDKFTIYDSDDQVGVIKDVLKRLELDPKRYKEKAILSRISSVKDNLIDADEFYKRAGSDYAEKMIAEVYRLYQETLLKNNAMDFDDMIFNTVKLFRQCPDVLEKYQERFRYIMVDEYQDTNIAQFKLVQILAAKYRNLCVVGDDDQSIYKFRGANIQNILEFEVYFPDAKVIKLEQNYRSTQNILSVANSVIANNSERKEKKLWTASDDGSKIYFSKYGTSFEEAEMIAASIATQINDGYEYKDVAILYRTNAQSRILEEKLINENIPYRIYGGVNFYSRKEIKDVLSYLKTIDNGVDDMAVRRIVNIPKRGIGTTSLDKIQSAAYSEDISLYEALLRIDEMADLKRTAAKVKDFTALIEKMRSDYARLNVKEIIEHLLDDIGYKEYLQETETDEEAEERLLNIDELISKAEIYEESAEEPSLSGFLEEVALVADIDNLDNNANIVSLMTLHSAKGLEFPVVYMAGMEENLFPSSRSVAEGESEVEEERRLCYVGITRAKDKLFMSAARQRMIRGEITYNLPSRFIREIPDEFLIKSETDNSFSFGGFGGSSYGSGTGAGFGGSGAKAGFGGSSYSAVRKKKSSVGPAADVSVYSSKEALSKSSALDYGVGDKVSHAKFGIGVVKEIKDGGRDFEVTVEFDGFGVKKMFAMFAKLTKA